MRGATIDIEAAAVDQWTISKPLQISIASAVYLSNQLDKIQATYPASRQEVVRCLLGGYDLCEGTARGYRIRDVDLIDGTLYRGRAVRHLRSDPGPRIGCRMAEVFPSASIYETWIGNRWFGNWLAEDIVSYPLAAHYARPITTRPATGHVEGYEDRLGMSPYRVARLHIDELFIFSDDGFTESRQNRLAVVRERLAPSRPAARHPGVYLLRGRDGETRNLVNEHSIAEYVSATFGLRVIDVSTATVTDLIDACATARIIVGLEGSHLVHGLMAMPSGSGLVVIQPPHRTSAALKHFTDRIGQLYAFVVADGTAEAFRADSAELTATIDRVLSRLS